MSAPRSDGTEFRYRRPICPFISSTFEDFKAERDVLVQRVFPAVDALCRQRGTYCAPIDLRWGNTDNVTSSSGVVRLSLDYVTRGCPFFLCLLGERYGPHRPKSAGALPPSAEQLPPDADWLDRNLLEAAAGGYDWLQQETYQHHSVTELQIVQATQLAEADHAYFYFRQPDHVDLLFPDVEECRRRELLAVYEADGAYGNMKVRDLKARIVKRGLPVRYFNTPDELARLALADWTALVDRLYPPLLHTVSASGPLRPSDSERFTERVAHETLAETRRGGFVQTANTEQLMSTMTEFAARCLNPPPAQDQYMGDVETFKHSHRIRGREEEVTEPGILVVVGDRGSGKTTLVANWTQEFAADHPEVHVICHHAGASARSADVSTFMQHCSEELRGNSLTDWDEGAHSQEGQDTGSLYALTEVFGAALALGPCLIVLDGLDELSGSYGVSPQQLKELAWLPLPLPPQCRVVVTTVPSDLTYRVLEKRRDTHILQLSPLTDQQAQGEILEEHINTQCRYVSSSHVERVVSSKLADRPLFLSIVAHEMRVLGVSPRLDDYLGGYLEAASVRDLWSRVARRWVNDYSWMVYNPLAAEDENSGKTKGYSGWVADVLRLIAVSKNGLCQSEIVSILRTLGYHGQREVTSFDWARFRWAAQGALYERPGGLLNFCHQHLKEAVEYTLLGVVTSCNQPRPCAVTPDLAAIRDPKARLGAAPGTKGANQFMALPFTEPATAEPTQKAFHQHLATFFTSCPPGDRRTEELPWQLEMCSNMEELCSVLSEPRMFLELHGDTEDGGAGRRDLLHYWAVLKRAGHDPSDAYRQVVQRVSETAALGSHSDDETEVKDGVDREVASPQSVSSVDTPSDVYAPPESESLSEHQKARLYHVVAIFLSQLGYLKDAEELLTMAYNKLYESYPLGDSAQHLLCNVETELGNLCSTQQDPGGAWKWYNKALLSLDSLMEGVLDAEVIKKHTEAKGKLLDNLGHLKTCEREYDEAEKLLRRAEDCMTRSGCMQGKASVHHHLGALRLGRGQFVEAEMMFRQAIETRSHLYGKSHPIVAGVLDDLAGLLCHPENQISFERYEAEALFRRALRIREKCLGPDHLLVATTLFHLGKLLKTDASSGTNRGECLQLLRRSLDIRTTKLGADHPDTLVVRRVLSALEAGGRAAHQPTTCTTTSARYSTMTWHDGELLLYQQRERAKVADAARLKAQRPPPSRQSMATLPAPSDGGGSVPPRRRPSVGPSRSGRSLGTVSRGPSSKRYGGSVESFEVPRGRREEPIKSLSVGDLHTAHVQHVGFPDLEPMAAQEEEDEQPPETGRQPEPEPEQRKQRPLSSYGRRSVPLTYVKFTEHHPALKVAPSSAVSKSSEYIDSYSSSPMPPPSGRTPAQPVQAKLVLRIARPRTDPNKLYRRYATSTGSTANSSTESPDWRPPPPPATRATSRSISLLPSAMRAGSSLVSSGTPSVYRIHRQQCYIPGRHTNDIHNAYSSTKGPNSSLLSLLGDPATPRDVFLQVCHKSAWYHVPGRYSTVEQPYAPKRSQRRPGSQQTASSDAAATMRLAPRLDHHHRHEGSVRAPPSDADYDHLSHNSWDSHTSVPVGAAGGGGGGGVVDSWMT